MARNLSLCDSQHSRLEMKTFDMVRASAAVRHGSVVILAGLRWKNTKAASLRGFISVEVMKSPLHPQITPASSKHMATVGSKLLSVSTDLIEVWADNGPVAHIPGPWFCLLAQSETFSKQKSTPRINVHPGSAPP